MHSQSSFNDESVQLDSNVIEKWSWWKATVDFLLLATT